MQEYADKHGHKKQKPVKIGLKNKQRDGIEYEFTTKFSLEEGTHVATAQDDASGLFDDFEGQIAVESGEALRLWLANNRPAYTTAVEKTIAMLQGLEGEEFYETKAKILASKKLTDNEKADIFEAVEDTKQTEEKDNENE